MMVYEYRTTTKAKLHQNVAQLPIQIVFTYSKCNKFSSLL